jgi:hypothetical protein
LHEILLHEILGSSLSHQQDTACVVKNKSRHDANDVLIFAKDDFERLPPVMNALDDGTSTDSILLAAQTMQAKAYRDYQQNP